MRDRLACRVGEREAPAGSRVHDGGELTARFGVHWAEARDLAGVAGETEPSRHRHREIDGAGQLRPAANHGASQRGRRQRPVDWGPAAARGRLRVGGRAGARGRGWACH